MGIKQACHRFLTALKTPLGKVGAALATMGTLKGLWRAVGFGGDAEFFLSLMRSVWTSLDRGVVWITTWCAGIALLVYELYRTREHSTGVPRPTLPAVVPLDFVLECCHPVYRDLNTQNSVAFTFAGVNGTGETVQTGELDGRIEFAGLQLQQRPDVRSVTASVGPGNRMLITLTQFFSDNEKHRLEAARATAGDDVRSSDVRFEFGRVTLGCRAAGQDFSARFMPVEIRPGPSLSVATLLASSARDFGSSEGVADIRATLVRTSPEFDLPEAELLGNSWIGSYDAATGYPVYVEGAFTPYGRSEIACIVAHRTERRYRIVVLTMNSDRTPRVLVLEEVDGSPTNRYVSKVRRGRVDVGRSVWQHGGPRSVNLTYDAVQVGSFESSACIYYWDTATSSFQQQWISD